MAGNVELVKMDHRQKFEETRRYSGPFRATKIWNDIIEHLRERVEVKRRRQKVKYFDCCFTGQDAVNVLLRYLMQDSVNFGCDVSREKAVKLCQALMDYNVFEPVSPASPMDSPKKFQDMATKLYRFTATEQTENRDSNTPHRPEDRMRIRKSIEPDLIDGEGVISNPMVLTANGKNVQEELAKAGRVFSAPQKRSCSHRDEIPEGEPTAVSDAHASAQPRLLADEEHFLRKSIRRFAAVRSSARESQGVRRNMMKSTSLPTVPSIGKSQNYGLSDNVVGDVWREISLLRLLLVVEIPIIEGIIHDEDKPALPPGGHHFVAPTNVMRKHNSCSAVTDSYLDVWTESAFSCLNLESESYKKTLEKPETNTIVNHTDFKIRLFKAVASCYTKLQDPLIAGRMFDVFLVIFTTLIEQQKTASAIEALQLAVLLLPSHRREQLKHLFEFMKTVSQDTFIRLSKQMSNKEVMLHTFTSAIIRSPLLSSHRAATYLGFILEHNDGVFTVPCDIEMQVDRQLRTLSSGLDAAVIETTYCEQVSEEEFERQRQETSETALKDLVNSIIDDASTSLRSKKHWLKKLQKCHPDIYDKHFADML
ncbi:PREDICTED: DEP domain-containing protein 7-like isoform X2 [Priapulus caudatus]|uniref:DEP domain-containing protein 7-like isoform X2 n=1 Tax=Priapulus caudatus TaxID=37621 RepID=A0ABM1DRR9_PRICU|nr:PREDICTED: DEP domain-containing protein 7-like isoform X2 [Priapulus caudatus]